MPLKVHEFTVDMACGGCATAVEKVLGKLKGQGVEDINISLEDKKVRVTSTLTSEQLLETIRKTGKTVEYIGTKD